MRAVFVGCVEASWRFMEILLDCPGIEICGVVTRQKSTFNSDFRSLEPLAESKGIPIFNADDTDQDTMADWIEMRAPDVCFCLGWSYLLKQRILEQTPLGVIGYHPTLLPRNRGRHPIVWSLALGLEITGSTFFVMDEGADSGDIVSQLTVPIHYEDDAATLYSRLLDIAGDQLRDITTSLVSGTLHRQPQNHAVATYWRKRDKRDGEIDWRMPAEGIRNLVRALARPYVGAHCRFDDEDVKIWRVEKTLAPDDIEPGRVLSNDDGYLTVKAGTGAVHIIHHEFLQFPKVGSCL